MDTSVHEAAVAPNGAKVSGQSFLARPPAKNVLSSELWFRDRAAVSSNLLLLTRRPCLVS